MLTRLTKIEPEVIHEHHYLKSDDECYFFLEYTSQRDYTYTPENDFINNLKKSPLFRNRPDVWRHKEEAIQRCSKGLCEAINRDWLKAATLVPIPPSKEKSDVKGYDDRMLRVLLGIKTDFTTDVRELVVQTQSFPASHMADSGERTRIDELRSAYEIDEEFTEPAPENIGIVDDVRVAGAHYRAMHSVLSQRFPAARIVGFFIARRIFPPTPSAAP